MRSKTHLFSIPYVVWMAFFVVAPIIIVVIYAFTSPAGGFSTENFQNMSSYLSVFGRSFWLALLSTALCLALGYPLAFILSRERAHHQRILVMLFMLPMWMNMLLRTYAWLSILENTGLFNRLLGALGLAPVSIVNTQGAIVLGMVYNFLPFMVLPIYSVLSKIDRSYIEAAQDLGAHPGGVFRRVLLPLSLPGVLSGITMVFVPAVSTFIISRIMGGGKFMLLGDLIEMQFLGAAYNPYLGSAIALVMMVIVMICMLVMNKFGSGDEQAVTL